MCLQLVIYGFLFFQENRKLGMYLFIFVHKSKFHFILYNKDVLVLIVRRPNLVLVGSLLHHQCRLGAGNIAFWLQADMKSWLKLK